MTAPNLAIWAEGRWVVENEGVPPDVEVEQWPADVIAGKDPQLEKAIEIVLSGLAKHPPVVPAAAEVSDSGEMKTGCGPFRRRLPVPVSFANVNRAQPPCV